MVRRAGGISPGTLGMRPFEAHAAVCVFPVWRRPSPMNRECFCCYGSDADSRDRCAEVSATAGTESAACPACVDYAAPSTRRSRGAGIATAPCRGKPFANKPSHECRLAAQRKWDSEERYLPESWEANSECVCMTRRME